MTGPIPRVTAKHDRTAGSGQGQKRNPSKDPMSRCDDVPMRQGHRTLTLGDDNYQYSPVRIKPPLGLTVLFKCCFKFQKNRTLLKNVGREFLVENVLAEKKFSIEKSQPDFFSIENFFSAKNVSTKILDQKNQQYF